MAQQRAGCGQSREMTGKEEMGRSSRQIWHSSVGPGGVGIELRFLGGDQEGEAFVAGPGGVNGWKLDEVFLEE